MFPRKKPVYLYKCSTEWQRRVAFLDQSGEVPRASSLNEAIELVKSCGIEVCVLDHHGTTLTESAKLAFAVCVYSTKEGKLPPAENAR